MTRCLAASSLIVLSLLATAAQGQRVSADSTRAAPAVANASDAVNQALKYTGFDKLPLKAKATSQTAELVVVTGDSTPFLAERMNGQEAWQVTFDSVGLQYANSTDPEKTYYRNYEVFIEPSTGYLVKLVSRLPGQHDDVFPQPSVESAERQLRHSSEAYHGYAAETGMSSFSDVLPSCWGNPLVAKEIRAICVMYTWGAPPIGHDVPRPFWIISVRGAPPLAVVGMPPIGKGWISPDSVSLRCRTSYRSIIDARNGKLVSETNIPILEQDTLRER